MKILVLGSKGQLGQCLNDQLAITEHDVVYTSRGQIDIAEFEVTKAQILEISPDIVINATAYTAVDKAEEEHQAADRINHLAVANISKICNQLDCWLIHVSTDYVFDGLKKDAYTEIDKANPKSVYGKSKYDAETAICECNPKHIILRTSWVYSLRGKNFLTTILGLAKNKESFDIIFDQIGSPTSAIFIANTILEITKKIEQIEKNNLYGIYNLTCSGSTSWFEFAKTIILFAQKEGLSLKSTPESIKPVKTSDFITLASRPKNSTLNNQKLVKTFEINCPEWQNELKLIMSNKI